MNYPYVTFPICDTYKEYSTLVDDFNYKIVDDPATGLYKMIKNYR